MPSSRGSPQPRDQTRISYISYIGGRFFTTDYHLGSPLLPCPFSVQFTHSVMSDSL